MISLPLLFALAFAAFCVFMARYAVLSHKKANASCSWPTTEGVLVEVHLWGTRNVDGEMIPARNLRVSYEYEVGGVQYSGSHVAFYQLHYPETTDFAKAHPQGSSVRVFYNPENFAESVLTQGPHPTKPHGGLILAFLGVVIGVGVSVAAWMGVLN